MASTVLPKISTSFKAEESKRHWTPGPAYLPGTSQRDPILGTVKPYQNAQSRPSLKLVRIKTLPDIYQRNFNKNSRYEARVIVVVDKKTGKKMKLPKVGGENETKEEEEEKTRLAQSTYHSNVHERSVFGDTGRFNSYFIIHPDWTSEGNGIRRLSCKEKSHYSYDSRPAVHPLSSYIEPLLEKRRLRDQYIKSMEQAKHIENFHARAQSRAQSQRRAIKPVTPKDPTGQYKGFSMY